MTGIAELIAFRINAGLSAARVMPLTFAAGLGPWHAAFAQLSGAPLVFW